MYGVATLLLVEDEYQLSKSIRKFLEGQFYKVVSTDTLNDALKEIEKRVFDVAIIDINLPDGNGNQLIKEFKSKQEHTGIIIISSDNMTRDKVRSLDLGADDYLTKPFDLQELNARVRSVMRRKQPEEQHQLTAGDITLNPNEYKVFVRDKELALTKKEFELLMYFMTNQNHLVTKEVLASHLWGINIATYDNYDFIYTHVKNLRKKLLNAKAADHIQNVHGIGYRFTVE